MKVGTYLKVSDSSGARRALCIRILRKVANSSAKMGDLIVVAIKKARPHKKVKAGEVHWGIVIRDAVPLRRKDGQTIRFGNSSCVLIDKKTRLPKAKRIFGPVPRELRIKGFLKIVSLATIAL